MRGFTPSSGLILIAPLDQDKKGFTLPDKEENRKGKVVAVGLPIELSQLAYYQGQGGGIGSPYIDPPCKVGDVIYHAYQYEGDVLLKGIKYKIIRFDSVLGIYVN